MVRELEPPGDDEGFAAVEVVPFLRRAVATARPAPRFVALDDAVDECGVLRAALVTADAPTLLFGWRSGSGGDAPLPDTLPPHVAVAVCRHAAGPPRCWCRPPLPGLPLAFAHARGLDASSGVVVGSSAAHRTLAATLGARYESP
jgi:hypothetical protein